MDFLLIGILIQNITFALQVWKQVKFVFNYNADTVNYEEQTIAAMGFYFVKAKS